MSPSSCPIVWFMLPLLVGCHAAPSSATPPHYTLVLLRTGPRTEPLTAEEQRKVFAGHFDNMERLAREGSLLLAGPYGQERTDPTLRGLFVLDTADLPTARALAETDPTFQAGVFALDYHRLETDAALRAVRRQEIAARDLAVRAGKPLRPGEGGRTYVWLSADDWQQASAALAGQAFVLWFARLDGDRALVLLDADEPATARRLLAPLASHLGQHRLDAWFGTGLLADLPRLRDE